MTQNGVVTKLVDRGRAQVAVTRQTACGGHCAACEACVYDRSILVLAENDVCARPGERVVLESRTGGVIGAAALMYLLPAALLLAGGAAGALCGLSEGLCALLALGGAALGGVAAALLGRRKRIDFRITGFER